MTGGRNITLVRITNPNPHPLQVWIGGRLQHVLPPKETIGCILTADFRVRYNGKVDAIIVVQAEGGDWDGEEWMQVIKVNGGPVALDPEKPYVPQDDNLSARKRGLRGRQSPTDLSPLERRDPSSPRR